MLLLYWASSTPRIILGVFIGFTVLSDEILAQEFQSIKQMDIDLTAWIKKSMGVGTKVINRTHSRNNPVTATKR